MTRPVKLRRGARVVLVAGDETLLLRDTDPGVPGSGWWVVPGGGIDDGERDGVAACREVAEETGLLLGESDLEGPIARRRVIHGYSDRILVQAEVFFRARVPRFEASDAGLTDRERRRTRGSAWFPLAQLPPDVWPRELARLAAWPGGAVVDLGLVEESTVPAGDDWQEGPLNEER